MLKTRTHGFTIVELLIVIVVIGILAAITIVAFNGISDRAKTASLQSDLSQAARQLGGDNAVNSKYPASAALANNGTGLKAANGTDFTYSYDSATNTYCLTATSGTSSYMVTSADTKPTAGTCPVATTNGGVVTTLASGLSDPWRSAVDTSGNLFVSEFSGNRIRKITSAGVMTTFAGSGTASSVNGTGTGATFNGPGSILIDASNNLYVAEYWPCSDLGNCTTDIRKITPTAVVTTFGGTGVDYPEDIVFDATGKLYVATSYGSSKIVKITPPSTFVSYYAGGTSGSGFVDGAVAGSKLNGPHQMAFDSAGNLFIADTANNRIRKVTTGGVVSTFAGSGVASSVNGTGTAATFNNPRGVAFDSAGNLFVADTNGRVIRKITPTAVVTTFAGSGVSGAANGTGTAAQFSLPIFITIGPDDVMYVSDNSYIRKIQ